MHARHTDTNRHESIARTDANRARRSRNVAPRASSRLAKSPAIYGCESRDAYSTRLDSHRSSPPLGMRDEREGSPSRVGTWGQHPIAAFPRRVERRGSSCVSAPSASAARADVSRTRVTDEAPTTSETRRELVCTSGVRDDASEARARVDGSGHPSNQWAPIGTPSPSTRARAILGRLSASSPRDGRGVVHAANARHAVDVTSWAASTAAHTTTATAAAAAYTADRSSRRVFLTAVSLGASGSIIVWKLRETRVGEGVRRRDARVLERSAGDGWGTHNAATRFTTFQKTSVMMLRRHGERLSTTEPASREERQARASGGARGSRAGFLRGRGGCTAPRPGGRTVPDVRHARPRVDPPPARGVECRPPAPRVARVWEISEGTLTMNDRESTRVDDRPCRWRASFPARAAPTGRRHPHRSMTFSGVDEDVFRSPPPASTPPRFVASPHASASAEARESTCGLDAAFNRVVFEIQQRLHLLARGPKIRVQFWLRKLHEHVRPWTVTPRNHTRTRTRHRDDPSPNQNPDPESTSSSS